MEQVYSVTWLWGEDEDEICTFGVAAVTPHQAISKALEQLTATHGEALAAKLNFWRVCDEGFLVLEAVSWPVFVAAYHISVGSKDCPDASKGQQSIASKVGEVVDALLLDLFDRAGLEGPDEKVQIELRRSWRRIITRGLFCDLAKEED